MFLSRDLFNLYVGLELLSLAAIGLVAIDGKPAALAAAMRYMIFALAGSLLYLAGVVLTYAAHGVLDAECAVGLAGGELLALPVEGEVLVGNLRDEPALLVEEVPHPRPVVGVLGRLLGEDVGVPSTDDHHGLVDGVEQRPLVGADAEQAQEQVPAMIENARQKIQGGFGLSLLLSIAALLFSATGAFAQLQMALNTAWNVEPAEDAGGIKAFLMKRVLSFGMILAIAFLLLVSLALSAAVSLFTTTLSGFLPDVLSGPLLWVVNEAVALGIITLLFATIFKVLPDVRIRWKDVWMGAFVTALLFVIGKALIGFYLGRSNPGSTFGQAGALAVILVWVYYSALIFFVGAEFTQVWARTYGVRIEPESDAVRVVEEKRRERESESERPEPEAKRAPHDEDAFGGPCATRSVVTCGAGSCAGWHRLRRSSGAATRRCATRSRRLPDLSRRGPAGSS